MKGKSIVLEDKKAGEESEEKDGNSNGNSHCMDFFCFRNYLHEKNTAQ